MPLHTFRDTGHLVAAGENDIRTGPLMQAQVLTVTATVPGVQQCTNKETVLQEERSASNPRRCHILRVVVSLHKQSTKFMQGSHRATQKNHRQVEQSTIFLEQ